MKYLESISEIKYLSVEKTPIYRAIMRSFYTEYMKMNQQLYKEDVYELVMRDFDMSGYSDYGIEHLRNDLDTLVENKNLIATQDSKRVRTLEEYKNKQFRYSMSKNAVEIERMTIVLENLIYESGSLSTNLFPRILDSLLQIDVIMEKSLKEINEWWKNLQEDFRRLCQNYQDYLSEFNSVKSEKLLKSIEFVQHKDRFISYLKEFIRELQLNSTKIEIALSNISETTEIKLLSLVVESELEIPRTQIYDEEEIKYELSQIISGNWNSLKAWFLRSENRISESMRVLEITNEIIRKIIYNAQMIMNLNNWGISRKEDYKKIISMFLDCENVEEAHKLGAHIFGIQNIRHFKINSERTSDSINMSVYSEEGANYLLKPRVREFKARVDTQGFTDKSKLKLEQRDKYLQKLDDDKSKIFKYIKGGELKLSDIDEEIEPNIRMILLSWIAKANASVSEKKIVHTEYGNTFELLKTDKHFTLKCTDGDLYMPEYIFKVVQEV